MLELAQSLREIIVDSWVAYQGVPECDMEVYKYTASSNVPGLSIAFYKNKHFAIKNFHVIPTQGWAGEDGGRRLKELLNRLCNTTDTWDKTTLSFEMTLQVITAYLRDNWEHH
jgi:hypothetical protein